MRGRRTTAARCRQIIFQFPAQSRSRTYFRLALTSVHSRFPPASKRIDIDPFNEDPAFQPTPRHRSHTSPAILPSNLMLWSRLSTILASRHPSGTSKASLSSLQSRLPVIAGLRTDNPSQPRPRTSTYIPRSVVSRRAFQ
jgi:hypothetical protein